MFEHLKIFILTETLKDEKARPMIKQLFQENLKGIIHEKKVNITTSSVWTMLTVRIPFEFLKSAQSSFERALEEIEIEKCRWYSLGDTKV